ncbi:phage major tail tube protein [Bacillota bacterium Meth-B3]
MDKKLNIIAQKCIDDGVEIKGYVSADLPEFSNATTEVRGAGVMGTLDVPSTAQIESAELTLNYQGIGSGRAHLMRPGKHSIELRTVQDVFDGEGGVQPQSVKIFITCFLKSTGGGSLENASAVEGSATYEVARYEEYVDGVETVLIDKNNFIYRINGVDSGKPVRGFLD